MRLTTTTPPSDSPQDLANLYANIDAYYTGKIVRFGATPLGVDWACVPTQEMRFVQLLKVCNRGSDINASTGAGADHAFSLNDLGCGYGALLAFITKRYKSSQGRDGVRLDYQGVDLSAAMVAQARRLWPRRKATTFVQANTPQRVADFGVASGIFNVKLHENSDKWSQFIAATLADLHRTSRFGFAVNFLNPLPAENQVTELYSVAPEVWARHCEARWKCHITVLEAYGLREHTLLVLKPP